MAMQINFTLKQMEVLKALVELKSFTKSAERLFMTQPGVSVQLKNLEAQVGVKLIEKRGQNFIVTDAGLGLYHHFSNILHNIENAKQYIDDVKGVVTGELKIGMASAIQSLLIAKISPFLQLYPNVKFKLFTYERSMLYQRLESGELDVIFASKVKDEYHKVFIEKVCIVPAVGAHEDTNNYPKSIYSLKKQNIVVPDEGTNTYSMWPQNVLENNSVLYSNSGHMVEEATAHGLGVGLVLEEVLKHKRLQKLNFKEFPQYLPLHIACLENMCAKNPTINAIFSYFNTK